MIIIRTFALEITTSLSKRDSYFHFVSLADFAKAKRAVGRWQ